MRIVQLNWSCRRGGGVETYLDTMMTALRNTEHEIGFCYESDLPRERARINFPPGVPTWCLDELGLERTLAAVRDWRPDVICTHNTGNLELERRLLDIAPAVFFAHAYQGTCISGSKSFSRPIARPCARRFGWECLIQFYPRRCGGLNPLTMIQLYREQAERLGLIKRYRAVLTHSEHMRQEYIRNGIPPERVSWFPYCVKPLESDPINDSRDSTKRIRTADTAWRMVFAGRMDAAKGGQLLLEALASLRSFTTRPLHLVFAGDGPERELWEAQAARLQKSLPEVLVEFRGWLPDSQLAVLFRASDLLVVPSVWPEPFGIVGPQAAIEGLPAAAFAVGGIPTWLTDGVTGHLAPGDPPTADGLARAIQKCLIDNDHYLKLCEGAERLANRFTVETHVAHLLLLLKEVTC